MTPLRDIEARIATSCMPVALTVRLGNLRDRHTAYDAVGNCKPIFRPTRSKTADRVLWCRGRDTRVTHITPRRELRYARCGDGTEGRGAHAAWRKGYCRRPAFDSSGSSISESDRDEGLLEAGPREWGRTQGI